MQVKLGAPALAMVTAPYQTWPHATSNAVCRPWGCKEKQSPEAKNAVVHGAMEPDSRHLSGWEELWIETNRSRSRKLLLGECGWL